MLLASLLFGILGSGSGCCMLSQLVHSEKYCGPSCGPTYWGPYHVDRCDPCDTCGNFVGNGYSHSASCCGHAGHGSGAQYAHYDGGQYDGGHYDSGPYDGEIIYEGPVRDAPVNENAVYQRPVRTHASNVTYHHDAPERQVPHLWRMP
jgi:hypothetical protein